MKMNNRNGHVNLDVQKELFTLFQMKHQLNHFLHRHLFIYLSKVACANWIREVTKKFSL